MARERPRVVLQVAARPVVPVVILALDAVHRDDERTELGERLEFGEGPPVGEERAQRVAPLVRAEQRYLEREAVAAGVAAEARVAVEAPEVANRALVGVDHLEREAEPARGFRYLEIELEPDGLAAAVHAA